MQQIIDLETGKLVNVNQVNNAPKQPAQRQPQASNIINLEELEKKRTQQNPLTADYGMRRNIQDALTPMKEPDISGINNTEAFFIASNRGTEDLKRGLGFGVSENKYQSAILNKLEEEYPIASTIGRVAGQVIPQTPVLAFTSAMTAGAPLTVQVSAGAGIGATEGDIISRGMNATEEEVNQATVIGGVVGGATELLFPIFGRIGNTLVSKVLNKKPTAPVVNKLGQPSPELQEALSKAGLTFDDLINDAQEQLKNISIDKQIPIRRQTFKDAGIENPTRAQLTGEASDFQQQQELFKVSGPVRSTIEQQDQQLFDTFSNAVTSTGNPSSSYSYNPVVNFVTEQSLLRDKAISDAYQSARLLTNDSKVIKPDNLIKQVRTIAGTENASGGVYTAVKGFMKQKGLLTGKKFDPNGLIDANTAESLRIDLNSLYNSVSPLGRQQIKQLKDALDEDVLQYAGEDAFKVARGMKAKFEKELTRTKNNKFDRRSKEFLRDILENKYSPDTFFNDAILTKSTRSSDIEQLKRYLEKSELPEATEAWNSVRADAAEWIRDNAFSEVGGVYALSRHKLEKALDRLGRDKMRVLFTKEERDFFNLMKQVSKFREPARMTQQGLGPSAQSVKALYNSMTNNSLFYDLYNTLKINRDGKSMIMTIEPPLLPYKREIGATTSAISVPFAINQTDEQPQN